MTPCSVVRSGLRQTPDVRCVRVPAFAQVASTFCQQVPGFAISLVAVAVFSECRHGAYRYPDLARWREQDGGGDQVPDLFRDDVRREYVQLIDAAGFLDQLVSAELTEIARAVADRAGFDLHSNHVPVVFDGDVIFEGVSAGFEYVISVRGGIGHELQFDPFASLLECSEIFPILHPRLRPVSRWSLVVGLSHNLARQDHLTGLRPQQKRRDL
jgi:hypothetical protein